MLMEIQRAFVESVENKNNDYNKVMRSFETLQNYILAL